MYGGSHYRKQKEIWEGVGLMNILVISNAFWPEHTGGLTKSLLTEVEGLIARGHHVSVVTRRLRAGSSLVEKRGNYVVYRYPAPDKTSRLYHTFPLFIAKNLPSLLRNIADQGTFDVAYIHGMYESAAFHRSHLNIPSVYVFHSPGVREIEIDVKGGKYGMVRIFLGPVKRWMLSVEQRELKRVNIVVVRSGFMKEELLQLYGEKHAGKVRVIPLGVNTESFGFSHNPQHIRERLGLPSDRVILLTVRRLVERTGVGNLIEAMRSVVARYPEVMLLIGGRGYLEDKLREHVHAVGLERHVQFLGFIPEEKLSDYYQAADLFVLPTAELEGFGLVTIEALSCGTPVIATPIGANREVLGELGSEFLFESASPEHIAKGIMWWLKQGISKDIRYRCRAYCVNRFSVDAVVSSLEAIFNEVKDG